MENDTVSKIRAFNRYYTKVIGLTNSCILESPYSLSEVRVMFEINNRPTITARTIKEIMQVDEGYLSRVINKLVKLDIIRKHKSKRDNRISSLSLTENGRKIFFELNDRSSNEISLLIRKLSTKEQTELTNALEKVEKLLNKSTLINE